MVIDGYMSEHPIHFYWHDALEVIEYIFGNPVFASHMQFDPHRLWSDECKLDHIYTEYMTGDFAWQAQVCCQILYSESSSSLQRTTFQLVQPS